MIGLLLLLACDAEQPRDTDTGTDTEVCGDYGVTYDNWGEGFLTTWCLPCHSQSLEDRFGAPEGIDFDTWGQVDQFAALIRLTVLDEESMPEGGGLQDEDKVLLDELLRCEFDAE